MQKKKEKKRKTPDKRETKRALATETVIVRFRSIHFHQIVHSKYTSEPFRNKHRSLKRRRRANEMMQSK